ncbi:dynein regulatory complex subunit 2 [Stomoxys calcitrans]|uniref:dynein regulatory complex subunit 2 n=1 Tax=Stomoxys calcitrans TaxID=35570 RepID=UPI0027E33050|nr:dynein regulatory complex subunit 2 [Stomoxys calcitrans]
MGKKGKGNKLAKMSEEERARYLQMRADIEEEARRRKMQLISMYMKNKLKREEAFSRLNMAKINQEWRSILRQVKCQELRKEIVDTEKYSKDMLEHKDSVIKRLLHDLEVAHSQHDNSSQTHMEMLQHFMNIQQQRLEFFKNNYDSEREAMLLEFNEDFNKMQNLRVRTHEQLENVYYQLEEKNENQRNEAHERYLAKLDDIKAMMQLRIEDITEKGEQKLEKLWNEYQQALAEYVQHTEGFYADYMDLKERDEEYTNQTREYCYEIEKASNQLAALKLTLADAEDKSEVRLKHLKDLKEYMGNKHNELKERIDVEMMENEEKFKMMSVESYKAVKFFKNLFDKGNTLLQLVTVCRKFETEKEKILPLGLPPISKLMFENEAEQYTQVPEELKAESFCNWQLMEDFWKRVNNVKIDLVCLTQRKRSLEQENERLKSELEERLMSLNISNGINTHVNDYLAKRPSSMRIKRVERIDLDQRQKCQSADVNVGRQQKSHRPHTTSCITEANFTTAVRSRLLAKGKPKLAKIVAIKH